MNATENNVERLLSLAEVRSRLGVSTTTLWRIRKSKRLPFVQIGARVLVASHDVEAFIESNKTTTRRATGPTVRTDLSVDVGDGDVRE